MVRCILGCNVGVYGLGFVISFVDGNVECLLAEERTQLAIGVPFTYTTLINPVGDIPVLSHKKSTKHKPEGSQMLSGQELLRPLASPITYTTCPSSLVERWGWTPLPVDLAQHRAVSGWTCLLPTSLWKWVIVREKRVIALI